MSVVKIRKLAQTYLKQGMTDDQAMSRLIVLIAGLRIVNFRLLMEILAQEPENEGEDS